MRKTLFIFVFAFVLGVCSTIFVLSPGGIPKFIEQSKQNGSFSINKARDNVNWNTAEERVVTGVTNAVNSVSEWDMFNKIRARQFVKNDIN